MLEACYLILHPRSGRIVGLTTVVYSRRVCLKEGPYVDAVICEAAANAAAPLWVTCVMCVFQFSLESI